MTTIVCYSKTIFPVHCKNRVQLIFKHQERNIWWMFGSSLPPVDCRRDHVLYTLFVFACILCPTHIVLWFCFVCLRLVYPICYQFLCIVHFWLPLRLVYPMLPVSLHCPFLIAPSSCVLLLPVSLLSTLCYQFLCIVHFWLSLQCSLTFISCKEAAIERSMESNYSIHIKVEQWHAFVCPFELSGL